VNSEEQRMLAVARALAERAAAEVRKRLDSPQVQSRKADHSPVTEADMVADRIIREGLLEAFPGHAVLTEETGLTGDAASPWAWCVDPLDGTKAYAKKIPGFCVMIGLLKEGKPHLGVVADPLEGRLYQAVRGAGAEHHHGGKIERLRVSSRREFSQMPLIVSTDFPEKLLVQVREALNGPILPPINSVGIKVGLLVRQLGDIYVNHHSVHYWDTCAPQIILEEAGGAFTRLDGAPLDYPLAATSYRHAAKTLASNGTRHSELVQRLEKIF
jgi:3'(2'), 5'-bisphosphate nucleotidase